MKSSKGSSAAGLFTTEPVPVVFAFVILAALIILALLRHFFGAIRLEAGTK